MMIKQRTGLSHANNEFLSFGTPLKVKHFNCTIYNLKNHFHLDLFSFTILWNTKINLLEHNWK